MLKVDNIIPLWRVVISKSDITYGAQIINLSRERPHMQSEKHARSNLTYGLIWLWHGIKRIRIVEAKNKFVREIKRVNEWMSDGEKMVEKLFRIKWRN